MVLFAAESFDRIFSGSGFGWNKAADEGQNNTENNECEGILPCEVGLEIFDTREVDENNINYDNEEIRNANSECAGKQADDEGFCIENGGNIAF